jgi:hypothetical protein
VNRTLVGEVQALCTPTVLDQLTKTSKLVELARSLEVRSGAYHAPALPVELYQRSWRGDSNADHGLTRPALFPLSYASEKLWRRWGELHSRLSALQADALLSWLHRLIHLERKAGLELALSFLACLEQLSEAKASNRLATSRLGH